MGGKEQRKSEKGYAAHQYLLKQELKSKEVEFQYFSS